MREGPKAEEVVEIHGVEAVNKWLKDRVGTLEIVKRDVLPPDGLSSKPTFIIWYIQHE